MKNPCKKGQNFGHSDAPRPSPEHRWLQGKGKGSVRHPVAMSEIKSSALVVGGSLSSLVSQVESENLRLKHELGEAAEQAKMFEEEIRQIKVSLSKLKEERELVVKTKDHKIKQIMEDLKLKEDMIKGQQRQIESKCEEIEGHLKSIQEKDKALEEQSAALKQKEIESKVIKETQSSHIEFMKNKFETESDEQSRELLDTRKKNESLRKQINAMKVEFEHQKSLLERKYKEAVNELENTKSNLNTVEKRVKESISESIKKSYDDLNVERERFNTEKKMLLSEKEQISVYKEKQISDINSERNTLQKRYEKLDQDRRQFEEQRYLYNRKMQSEVERILSDLDRQHKEKQNRWDWAIREKLQEYLELQEKVASLQQTVSEKKRKHDSICIESSQCEQDKPINESSEANSSNTSSTSSGSTATFSIPSSKKRQKNHTSRTEKMHKASMGGKIESLYSPRISRTTSSSSSDSMKNRNNFFDASTHANQNGNLFGQHLRSLDTFNFLNYTPSMSAISTTATSGDRANDGGYQPYASY